MASKFKSKRKKRFIVISDAKLKLTNKEFLKGSSRFSKSETMINRKFKRLRGRKK